jgi:peptide deformylase
MNLELVKFNDPILKKRSDLFPFNDPPFDPVEFSQELVKTMYDKNGINLTAPQVGISYRIFAMRAAPQNFVCFNPKMVQPSIDEVSLEETSVTFPKMFIKIKRPQHCRVRFTLPNGDVKTETFTGMTARVFQNSLDFLDGVMYYSRANPIHREIALRKWKLFNH